MSKIFFVVMLVAVLQGCAYNAQIKEPSTKAIAHDSSSATPLASQEMNNGSSYQPVAIKKVVKVGGWKLPDLSSFKAEKARRARPMQVSGSSRAIQIYETELKPIQEVLLEAEQLFLVAPEVVQIKTMTWLIESVTKFDIDERTFCYVVRGVLVNVDEKSKVISRLMTTTNLNYYDESGNGEFSNFEYGTLSPVPRIPDWVVQKAKSNAKL